jgi:hypothetical protein
MIQLKRLVLCLSYFTDNSIIHKVQPSENHSSKLRINILKSYPHGFILVIAITLSYHHID